MVNRAVYYSCTHENKNYVLETMSSGIHVIYKYLHVQIYTRGYIL